MKKGATSFKDTIFGVFVPTKIIKLETQGNKKGLEFVTLLARIAIKSDIDIP